MFAPYGLNFTWGNLSIQNARLVAGWLVKYGGSDRMRMTLTSLVILGQRRAFATNFETIKDEKSSHKISRGTYLQIFPLLLFSRERSCLCQAFWKSVLLSDTWWLTRLTAVNLVQNICMKYITRLTKPRSKIFFGKSIEWETSCCCGIEFIYAMDWERCQLYIFTRSSCPIQSDTMTLD